MPAPDINSILAPADVAEVVPFPSPTDRVEVAVYDTATGDIRQTVKCELQDMHRQHDAWPRCNFLESTGQGINPHDFVVNLKTMTFIPRTTPSVADLGRKEQDLFIASRVTSFQSGGKTYQMSPDTLQAMTIAAILGGTLDADGAPTVHTPAEVQKVLQDYVSTRDAATTEAASLLDQAQKATTRDALSAVVHSNAMVDAVSVSAP